jgi:hypothetical protein
MHRYRGQLPFVPMCASKSHLLPAVERAAYNFDGVSGAMLPFCSSVKRRTDCLANEWTRNILGAIDGDWTIIEALRTRHCHWGGGN